VHQKHFQSINISYVKHGCWRDDDDMFIVSKGSQLRQV